jgi:hypothetical protein
VTPCAAACDTPRGWATLGFFAALGDSEVEKAWMQSVRLLVGRHA